MNSIEVVGKNVEQAIENGLKELNVTRDKVTIEVKDTGGLFKKAKVVLTIDEDNGKEERAKNIKRLEELESRGELNNDFSSLLKSEKAEETTAKNAEKCCESGKELIDNIQLVCAKNESETAEKVEDKDNGTDEIKNDFALSNENVQTCASENVSDLGREKLSKGADKVCEFADEVFKLMGIDAYVEISETRDNINVEVVGNQANKIIGKRGDGLNALQYLCSVVASRADRDSGRVYVNACGYKEEREQELIKLARKLKYSAVRDEKPIKLEPMTALDRKTIHKALKDDDLVETHSEGEEPRRYIVISPKKQ